MKKKTLALVLGAALTSSLLFGCGKDTAETSSEASETAESDETAASDESTDESADDSTDETEEEFVVDYSRYLTDDGKIEGVAALDLIELPDFSAYTFAKADLLPDEETIQAAIDSVMSGAFTEDVEGAVEDGDTVVMDYIGTLDGEEFENQTDVSVTAGSDSYVDDFLTKIIGHEVGENFDIEITFPEDYSNEDVAGQTTNFNITIQSASRPAELTDEFVQENKEALETYFGEVESVQDIRDMVSDYYYDSNLQSAIVDKMVEDSGLDSADKVPENALLYVRNLQEISLYSTYGITMDTYCETLGLSEEDLNDQLYEQAAFYTMVQAIAEDQGMEATDEKIAEYAGTDDISSYVESYGRGYLAQYCLTNMAYDYVKDQVIVTE